MANRTVKFTGIAFSNAGSVNIQATFNNQTVFNGDVSVPTTEGTSVEDLFTFDIDQTIDGNIPLTFTVTGGTVKFVDCLMNYTHSSDFVDTMGPRDKNVAVATDFFSNDADMKTNISIDGDAYDTTRTAELTGSLHVEVLDGSTLACDIVTNATNAN
jgi:hypothetical protein